MISGAKWGEEEGREAGLLHIPGWGAPRAFPGHRSAPSGHRAGQGNRSHSPSPGKSHDCSVLLQVSQLLWAGGSVGWWGEEEEGGEEAGSKHKTTERASSLRSENTSRLRSPVGGCMCGNETGRGLERGKSKQVVLGCYPPISPFLTHQLTPLWGEGLGRRCFTKRPSPILVASSAVGESDGLSSCHLRSGGAQGGGLGKGENG